VGLTCRHASTINREVAAGVTVSETGRCPYCGSVPGPAGAPAASEPDGPARAGLEPLYREMRRIREIAEAHAADSDARRIAELTRQVHELRATVARLRGPGVAARPVPASARTAQAGGGVSGC
jgi:hypothetical protein